MELDVNYLISLSETWLPIVLQYGAQLVLALLTLGIGWWLISLLVAKVGGLLTRRNVDPSLHGFVGSVAGVVLKIMLLISAASMVGVETTSFIAMLGAAGLAVGLALQGSLSNFAGGVLILTFRPYRVGEFIEAQGVSGTVTGIQIFHTMLKTPDGRSVVMPNGSLSNGTITNFSREPLRRAEIVVGISYDSDIKLARKVLLEMAEDPRVQREPAPVVVVTALADSSVNLALRLWVANADLWPVTFQFIEEAKERLSAAGVDIPFPQRVLHMRQA